MTKLVQRRKYEKCTPLALYKNQINGLTDDRKVPLYKLCSKFVAEKRINGDDKDMLQTLVYFYQVKKATSNTAANWEWARPAFALLFRGLAVAGDLRTLTVRVVLATPHRTPRREC